MDRDSHSTDCELGQNELILHDTPSKILSIRGRMALYPRERLFVHPFLWSERQLSLLGCKFVDTGDSIDEMLRGPVGEKNNTIGQTTVRPTDAQIWDMGPAANLAFGRDWFERMLSIEGILHSISSRPFTRQ